MAQRDLAIDEFSGKSHAVFFTAFLAVSLREQHVDVNWADFFEAGFLRFAFRQVP